MRETWHVYNNYITFICIKLLQNLLGIRWETIESLSNPYIIQICQEPCHISLSWDLQERDGKGRESSEHLFIESTLLVLLHLIFEQVCEASIIISSYKWGNWSSKGLSDLPEVLHHYLYGTSLSCQNQLL